MSNKKTKKDQQLEQFRTDDAGKHMTTNHGVKVSEDEFSLKAGERGPTLLEDFHFREKMTHFDHERIPERIVHARGFSAHGEFELYESLEKYTKADFLTDTSKKTPTFVRFSTVAGSKGSAETVRDARGFATKFYTDEGNYDLVGNNIPVFFIQDAMKFPDLVHALKPEPHNGMPQAASAHDTFWDFVGQNQESAHMVMWTMSDRAIPRSFRMMEGFGVHTFRLVNKEGNAHFVKFHWKPVLGTHSLVWDEAQKINGKDPDFHRGDLYQSIETGDYPEYELGIQVIPEEDEFKFDFDILDPTKLWPEEDVPVQIVGKMTLKRNVDNVFAENEQVAFHPGNVVPGIDFTNDPLLQGRLFSYTDTQLIRLGGPNFHELPINRPVCPFFNNHRDGYGRQTINKGQVSYHKNALASNTPTPATEEEGGYKHYQERVEGYKIRARSDSFKDHFSQAALFWNSMSDHEKNHLIQAFSFELGKVESLEVREQVVEMFANVSLELAKGFAKNIGVTPPESGGSDVTKSSPALSQANTAHKPDTRKVGVILANGFKGKDVKRALKKLSSEGIMVEVISDQQGVVKGEENTEITVDHTFLTTDSVLYDALYAVGGCNEEEAFKKHASHFLNEAFSHYKPLGATHNAVEWLKDNKLYGHTGVVSGEDMDSFVSEFVQAVSAHRHWGRQMI
ncbi:catalase [Halobacillus karajensis]|uniref:Catalase n=1 Tax=Halobacillus karajensis TaxID=195088 RepID=A0A059NYP0_9BACI|nr:catalase [Halobacillus karajensis]CDQ18582.1 Catalase HPII [Halobacillus karajensis]CDQ23346.1 Catalase HPII [Halobacillus karajensis]CDQ26828.1 Catalase HPII [Halobacillus karajensis]SEH49599.1 catalase [Halobacillus karajensis]